MTTVAVGGAAVDSRHEVGPVVRRAGRVAAIALGLGAVGQLLFFGVGIGINVPIALGLVLAAGWIVRDQRRRPSLADLWLGPAAITFAAFVSLRADPTIAALDTLTSLVLGGAALASFAGHPIVPRPAAGILILALRSMGSVATGAISVIAGARRSVPPGFSVTRRAAPLLPILRGLVVAIPLALVFIALFASADAVFAEVIEDLFGWRVDLDEGIGRIVLGLVIAWLAAGGLAIAATRPADDGASSPVAARGWRPGTTELVTVLLVVGAVFLGFVALQGAYLFGGLDTLSATGLTYSEYARRGFFELVVVAILAGGLIIGAERISRDRTPLLVWAGIALAALTGVVLASAVLRLGLYQEAYGWTELRLYVLGTIVLLAIGVVGLIGALAIDRVRWIGHLLVVAGLVIGLGLNVLGPARFITEQNVARALDPSLVLDSGSSGLDVWYVYALGDDAIPELVRALPALRTVEREALAEALAARLERLRASTDLNAWQAWNAGRSAARDALETARSAGDLP